MADDDGVACVVVDDALDVAAVDALRAGIRASRLIGDSQLTTLPSRPLLTRRFIPPAERARLEGGGFATTRGFGVICHADALDDAIAKVPVLAPFVPLAIAPTHRRRVRPLTGLDRVAEFVGVDDVNALYLNVLVVPPGAAVDRHTDATLGTVDA
ncbi:MAG TPA: hypothetical protein VGF99_06190, partial [Myxococcota bacterium]